MRILPRIALLCVFLGAHLNVARGQAVVIEDDFEDYLPGVSDLPTGAGSAANAGSIAAGLPSVNEDGCLGSPGDENQVLVLTDGNNSQGSWVWFPQQFDLNDSRVEIEFDLFIGRGTSATPADGVSVIFQFDGDLTAVGDAGGGIGVGHLRSQAGDPYEYVAVSFDIWDNGGVDPESPVDGRYGANSTAHVEVNQNIDPQDSASQALGDSPDYIASADVYSTTCDPDDLIHVRIVFDNRLMLIGMSGPSSQADILVPFDDPAVINYATMAFPDRLSNIGFTASTGSANAVQWIDNLVVVEDDSAVSVEKEPLLSAAAMNCAGPAVDATAEIGESFRAESALGGEIGRQGDIDVGLTITASRFGRVATGADFTNANGRPIDVSRIAGAGAETAKIFVNDAWSTVGVRYQAEVVPGRYAVDLFWSENFLGAINGAGQGTKLYDVFLNDEKVLGNWSAAAAAGNPSGSGDPDVPCVGVADTAIRRSFEVDAPDDGRGSGLLDVLVDDLGDFNPPENAALNALAFRRIGDTSGAAASGDTEIFGDQPTPPPAGVLIETEFDSDPGLCPPEMQCNTNSFPPQVSVDNANLDPRLRVTDDATGSSGTTAIFLQTVNVLDASLKAEFDVYMANPDGSEPADGGGFFVAAGNDTSLLGGAGGAMGVPTGIPGFAVEFDTWVGGGAGDDSGFNSASPWTHVGINDMSTNSIITNRVYDPDLIPVSYGGTGWPDFFNESGVHVEIEYNAGRVTVTLTGTEEDGVTVFGPTVVAETTLFPIQVAESVVGFYGGTGGRTQHLDFDNVIVEAEPGGPGESPESEAIARARELWDGGAGELFINSGGPGLYCSGSANPAPGATGDADEGSDVVWLPDLAGGGSLVPSVGEFFTVTPVDNLDGTNSGLQVAGSNMGNWDARGTATGVDDNDRIFHSERWADARYDIPVLAGADYEVTLYFANSHSGTAGTARRFFHVSVNGAELDGFEHPELTGGGPLNRCGAPNPVAPFDNLFDPVGAAELLYSSSPSDPCTACADNGVTVADDPDGDGVPAPQECGNAAAVAIRMTVRGVPAAGGAGGATISVAITEPDIGAGEPLSPDMNPKISGISVKSTVVTPIGTPFLRGDTNNDGVINLTDGIKILDFLFRGGEELTCIDAAETTGDGILNLTDAVRIFTFLFIGGADIPPPNACGEEPFADEASCASSGCPTR